MYTTTSLTMLRPEAYISVKRNRLKLYNNRNYYLKNQTNFEIELFNPTNESVLAKIWLNDELISPAGVVIKANSRVYLERFIDSPKKFQFNVFEVDNVKETKEARNRNGLVKIAFFNKIQPQLTYTHPQTVTYLDSMPYQNNFYFQGDNPYVLSSNGTGTINATDISLSCNNITFTSNFKTLPDQIETGRIKEGPKSDQKFSDSNEKFYDISFESFEYQILPESLKALIPQETRQYCSKCGTRIRKSSWQYCPSCGEEI